MSPHDLHRFVAFIDRFIDASGIDPPFHLVAISDNGSISISRHGDGTIEEVCIHTIEPGFEAPLTVTIIASDSRSRSARIEIEAGRGCVD